MRKIRVDEFARRLKEVSLEPDKRFAFFLGAGCSVTSGIPTAGGLVKDHWLPKLHRLRAPHEKLDQWAKQEFPTYEPNNPAAAYGAVIGELFLQPEERQREIERWCDGRFPGFGYASLASLMALEGGRFNIVLTTNFDDLVADALYLFTKARPLVIQHESLANFIRPTRTRPLVVKLHGDHRLSPQNTAQETATLKADIENQIRTLLHDRGLILIGYGGNDESIKKVLAALPPEALPLGIYWVSGTEPECALREWLEQRSAVWIESSDFDELMLLIRNEFDLPHPESQRFDDVFAKYTETYTLLSKRISAIPEANPEASALKQAIERADEAFENWMAVEIAADKIKKTDPAKADSIYAKGVEQFPQSAPLLGNYANFLRDIRKDQERAEEFYRRALAADPNQAINLGSYAVFLHDIHKNYERAEAFYQRALAADPNQAINLGNYANFLDRIRKDYDRAEEFYQRALVANSSRPINLGNYATFLHTIRKDHERAEELYRRALAADSNDAINLGNYANLLLDTHKDYDRAEEFYQRAVAADPNQAEHLFNYAVFLHTIRKDYERAEDFYQRSLAADPNQASNLGSYAAFLHVIRKDYDRAEEFYQRVLAADPNNAIVLGNCAGLLLAKGRLEGGLELLEKVVGLTDFAQNPALIAECWFYALAHRPARARQEALQKLKQAIKDEARSPGWNLTPNVAAARKNSHPYADWLEKLAAVISDGADPATLEDWREWKEA